MENEKEENILSSDSRILYKNLKKNQNLIDANNVE
jgi:hypothetical protein